MVYLWTLVDLQVFCGALAKFYGFLLEYPETRAKPHGSAYQTREIGHPFRDEWAIFWQVEEGVGCCAYVVDASAGRL